MKMEYSSRVDASVEKNRTAETIASLICTITFKKCFRVAIC